jgi:tetratricopeptide (TPR) repeat protein
LAFAAACVAVAAAASPTAAQQQVGRLTGNVKTIAGQPIKAATVRAENPSAVPREFTVTTDQKGEWGILGMRGGLWEITASAPGFEPSTVMIRAATSLNNEPVEIVLMGTPVKGAMDGVDTKKLQASLGAAESLMAEQKWDEAIAMYKVILAMVPRLDTVNLAIGRALRMKKDYAASAAAYGEVLKRDARNQKALLGLSRTQYDQGDRAAAIATLEQVVAIDGTTTEAAEARDILQQVRK